MKPLTVNGLPEEGLLIVSSDHPSFMEALRASATGEGDLPSNALPFSVVISNNSDQAVAAIAVVWEFIQADGRAIRHEKIVRETSLFGDDDNLHDLAVRVGLAPTPPARYVLQTHSNRLFSLVSTQSTGSTAGSGLGTGGALSRMGQTGQRLGPTEMRQQEIDTLSAILQRSVSWSVSIDGAFFENGRFAGPNKGDFFRNIAAEHRARIDLLEELGKLVKAGSPGHDFNEVFRHIEKAAGSQRPNLTGRTASDFYDFRKSILASRLMRIRERAGDQTIIDFVTRELNKPQVQLIAPGGFDRPPHSESSQQTRSK